MKKAAFHNLGCKVNAYETDAMERMLKENGYEIVHFNEEADIYIINTCSVTNIADRKSRQMIHKARKMNPNAIIAACGCYVQTSKEQVIEDGYTDIIIGNNNKKNIIQLIEEYMRSKEKVTDITDMTHEKTYEQMSAFTAGEHTRAYIKIQDGCNQFCSYCIIPYARGRVRSRNQKDILAEVKTLADKGYREVVLTGIHLSSYGTDFEQEEYRLIDIIEDINKIQGIERIRLGSLEPLIITDDFIKRLFDMKKVCPHFHLSMQSGCDEVLKRMNRRYTSDQFYEKCCIIRKYYEHPAITTDVIVGFPGETQDEFEQTYEFIDKVNFFEMHVFKYSRRKGTKADKMQNQIQNNIKGIRSAQLIEHAKSSSKKFREYYIGKQIDILFEEKIMFDGEEYYLGHTKEYVKAAIKTENDISNHILKKIAVSMLNDEILLAK